MSSNNFWESSFTSDYNLRNASNSDVEKAVNSNNNQGSFKSIEELYKQENQDEKKTLLLDPNEIFATGLRYRRRLSITEHTLRRMGRFTPFIASIITTRISQISAHSEPQPSRFEKGFIVRKKKRSFYSNEEEKPTKEEQNIINYITDFICNCGDPKTKFGGDDFNNFLKKAAEDSLTLDKGCFEVVDNKLKKPSYFFAADGATIYYSEHYSKNVLKNTKDNPILKLRNDSLNTGDDKNKIYPQYVQVINEEIAADYLPWEMCMGIRNPVTDVHYHGYGISELEKLINIVTWMLYSDAYNGKFFSQGSMPKGILYFPSGTTRSQMLNFRQQWISSLSGVENAWKMPTLSGDVQYIDLHKSNADMQFNVFQEYLFNICCAMFKITPEEVGFELGGSTGKSGKLGDAKSGAKERLNFSIRKGLIPIMKSFQTWLNKYVVNRIDPRFEMVFVGTDVDSEKEALEMAIEKSKHFVGFKEIREEWGYNRDLKEDDYILNAQYAQMKQNEALLSSEDDIQNTSEESNNDKKEIIVEDKDGKVKDVSEVEKSNIAQDNIEDIIEYYKKKLTK